MLDCISPVLQKTPGKNGTESKELRNHLGEKCEERARKYSEKLSAGAEVFADFLETLRFEKDRRSPLT